VLRGLLAVLLIGIVTLFFQDELMSVVVWPHRMAAEQVQEQRLENASEGDSARERWLTLAEAADRVQRAAGKPMGEGIAEAERVRAARELEEALIKLDEARVRVDDTSMRLTFLTYQETFLAHLKLCFLAALVLSLPYLLWEIWSFVAEGLHGNEKRWVHIFAPMSVAFFVAGVLFNYFVLTPFSLAYLATYGKATLFTAGITVDGYLSLFFGLSLGMGLIFELPLVLTFLSLIHVVQAAQLRTYRRYFLLVATIVAAFVTPTGDPWTLALATAPLLLLYEVGILAVSMVERGRA
jgi:Tat protein translocase TatC